MRIKLASIFFFILAFLLLAGCENSDKDSQITTTNNSNNNGISVPSNIASAALPQGTMHVYLYMDQDVTPIADQPVDYSNGQVTVNFENIPVTPGEHTFTISFKFQSSTVELVTLASASTAVLNLEQGSSTEINFGESDYGYPDDDSDNINNLTELERGSNPKQANQAPAITIENNFTINENTTAVTTVAGNDPDGDGLSFSIVGGVDQDMFDLDDFSLLYFISTPDFENPIDSDTNNVYQVTIEVSDGYLSLQQELSIAVTDVVDLANLVITASLENTMGSQSLPLGTLLAYITLNESTKQTMIMNGLSASLSLTNLPPGNHTIQLQFEFIPDTESVTYVVAEHQLTTTLGLGDNTIVYSENNYVFPDDDNDTISNLAELIRGSNPQIANQAPTFTTPSSIQRPENTTFVMTVSALDPDADEVLYAISGGVDGSLLTINENNGNLSFITPPDFELPQDSDGNNIYQVTVEASDGYLSAQQTISISVSDVIETIPVANAGPDQTVNTGELVTLDGSSSTGADTLSYNWSIDSVPSGSSVTSLSAPNSANPSFTPDMVGDYQFSLVVSDGTSDSLSDAVVITAVDANFNYAFVSPVGVSGAIGGLSAADTLCETWASSAGIPGTYRAILSTQLVNARDRLNGARGWIRTDGRPLADMPIELFRSSTAGPLAALRLGPDGTDLGHVNTWSASGNDGIYKTVASGTDCSGWTAADTQLAWYGFSDTNAEWLDRGTRELCSNEFHLYCFQINNYRPLDINDFAETGRRIFVSSGKFDVTSGISGADALCSADVTNNADLTGSFKAFLADVGISAASRFSTNNVPIVRLDGLRVSNNISALASIPLIHPITLQGDNNTWSWRVFTGASAPNVAGTTGTTCTGWSVATGTGSYGFSHGTIATQSGLRAWFSNGTDNCETRNNSFPVYCLEE